MTALARRSARTSNRSCGIHNLFHYGRNWVVPGDGEYTLRARIEPPDFMRHDEVNGKRFTQVVEAEFAGVKVKTGKG